MVQKPLMNKKPPGDRFLLIAGPCALESASQIQATIQILAKEQISFLRGGIYKLRTQPSSFQGIGDQAMEWIQAAKQQTPFHFVSEITDPRQLPRMQKVVDIFQVGARNMYNYELLKELGQITQPVILKRGFSARISEWLLAMEYILKGGNQEVILCERGIRTFETDTRNTLDLTGALVAQKESGHRVIVDPSHGTGHTDYITPLSLATLAAGLDGLLIEIHPNPLKSLSDGQQSLNFKQFQQLLQTLRPWLSFMNKALE